MRWQSLELSTDRRVQILDVTDQIVEVCRRSGVGDGVAVIVCEHTTAGLCVNEAEPNLLTDMQVWLERLVPRDVPYAHNRIDDNADAHLRSLLLGHSVTVPIEVEREIS